MDKITNFDIPGKITIPFFDHKGSLIGTIKSSSQRRKMNPVYFAYRKVRNIILYRLAYFCPINKWRIWMHRHRGCHIGHNVYIGQECSIDNAYPELVFIEDFASLNGGSSILCHTNVKEHFDGIIECEATPVVLRHHCLVSTNCHLLPGSEIGEYSIISTGSVVGCKIPPYTMAIGNPIKKIYNYKDIVEENKLKYPDKMW